MAKVHTNLQALARALKPEVKVINDRIISDEMRKLERRASNLLSDINSMWRGYEGSYQPAEYIRTGKTRSGFSLSPPKIEKDILTGATYITVYLILDDSAMWHDSILSTSNSQGHSFMLISEGWRWNQASVSKYGERYRLTNFDGIGIIDTLLSNYSDSNFEFKFYYEGQEYGGKKDRSKVSFSR